MCGYTTTGARTTYQGAEYDREEIELSGRRCEPPKKEGHYPAPDSAHEHDPWVRVAITEVAEKDLASHSRRVEDGCDDDGGQWRGHGCREGGDVQRNGEVGKSLKRDGKGLHALDLGEGNKQKDDRDLQHSRTEDSSRDPVVVG